MNSMKTIPTCVAAAALAIGGAAFVGCDRDDKGASKTTTVTTTSDGRVATDSGTTGEKVGDKMDAAADKTKEVARDVGSGISDAAQNAGSTIKGAVGGLTGANANRVPGTLGDVAEAALSKDGLDDVVERFVDADRNRIGKADLDKGNDALNALVASIAGDWKAKYNTDFDIHDPEKVLNASFMTATVGELSKDAGGVKVDVDTDRKLGGGTETKLDVDRKSGADSPRSPSADTNANDPGRNVATATIAASHGAPALTVPLIHEAGGWKIDVPDTLDAARLRTNLIAHLTEVQNTKAQWPASADEACRAVTHHVLMAVMDKPAK
jgi:hypothetical protein